MELGLDKDLFKKILVLIAPLGFTGILGFSYGLVSGTMVSKMMGNIDYAYFSNGARELPFIGALVSAITTVYMPMISKLMAEYKYKEVLQLKLKLNTMVAAVVYPVITLLIFWAKDLIILLMSQKYINSISVFIFFTAILYIRITDYQDVLIGAKRGDKIFIANIAFVIINLAMVYIGIKIYGITGAAMGVFLSVLFLAALLIKFTSDFCKSKISDIIDYKRILVILAICFVVALPLVFVENILLKVLYTSFYLVAVYFSIDYFKLANIKELIFKVLKR
jgi:O-antigen/teichoic acid export membrane protein